MPPATSAPIRFSSDGAIGELVLDNGPLNLVDSAMLAAFVRAVDEIEAIAGAGSLRCLIVHGNPGPAKRAFCAGSNIREFDSLRTGATERKILVEDRLLRKLERLPIPTIAALDALALGGGFEIALACDIRIARDGISVGLPECHLGGLAGSGSVRIARLIGPARAKELLYTGETLTAAQARQWGLVNRVADSSAPDAALQAARTMAAAIATRGPLSTRFSKQLVDASIDGDLDAALDLQATLQQRIFDSEDLHEGAAAFFERRAPRFRGR